MQYTVQQLAQLAGVTPRTLRWYDKVGLLQPKRAPNGYRLYGPGEVDRLQQILFYREAGLELCDIGRAIDSHPHSALQAMRRHLNGLVRRRRQLDGLIETAQKTIAHLEGEIPMTDQEKFEGFKRRLVDDNEAQYGEEVRRRWGNDAVDASNARMMNMSKEQYDAFTRLGEELNATLAKAVAQGDPAGETAQRAAALHKQWLCHTWGEYSPQAHRGLVQMYVDDERFTAYYEQVAPGAAAFLRDAVLLFTQSGPESPE